MSEDNLTPRTSFIFIGANWLNVCPMKVNQHWNSVNTTDVLCTISVRKQIKLPPSWWCKHSQMKINCKWNIDFQISSFTGESNKDGFVWVWLGELEINHGLMLKARITVTTRTRTGSACKRNCHLSAQISLLRVNSWTPVLNYSWVGCKINQRPMFDISYLQEWWAQKVDRFRNNCVQ